jgi:arylsulfatase A-like enzyme
MKNLQIITFTTLTLSSCVLNGTDRPTKKPNILIILSDDQGYADVGFQERKEVPTPNLDRLAKSGIRFTSGYVSHPFSSPSRAGLLTGRYQARFGHENNPVYDPLDNKEGLPLTERLLPQFMKDAGYTTGWIGKWHLGAAPIFTPWNRGFDETVGFIGGGHNYINWIVNEHQYNLPLTHNGEPFNVKDHLTTVFGNEASFFIYRHTKAPWMLYLAFNAPHTPHQPTAEREERFAHISDPQRRKCLAQVSLLDDAIGVVLDALAKSGQEENTLVFYLSDNGGPIDQAAVNLPLRGSKSTVYEGGVRVPFIVSWPGKLPADKTYDAPISSLDIFATSLSVANISMPTNKKYDGVNIIPYLSGKDKTLPHEYLFWRLRLNGVITYAALWKGQWKIILQKDKPTELYDIIADIGESINLAAEKPEIISRLTTAIDEWDKELVPPVFPGSSVKNEDWGPGGANQKNNLKAIKNK